MLYVAPAFRAGRTRSLFAAITASLLLGACASGGSDNPLLADNGPLTNHALADAKPAPRTELQKATDYWGKKSAENPQDPRAAVNYAKNLKAAGSKREALIALQEAHRNNPNDRELNSEYGRLALAHDQLTLAQQLLERADDPGQPDWRVISARGTVLAKQGKHADAIAYFERAREIAPDQPSVLNNLALAHAMNGKADKAESLLRQAAVRRDADPRVQQNLALVLGLNGKHEEAKAIGADNVSPEAATHNADMVRQLVKLDDPQEVLPAPRQVAAVATPQRAAVNQTRTTDTKSAPGLKLSTASVAAPAKSKTKSKSAAPAEPEIDAAELVRRLADADAGPKTN